MYSELRHANPWQGGWLAGQSFRDGHRPGGLGVALVVLTRCGSLKTNSGGWPRLSARGCVRLFVQRSSARSGAHLDSMTYAHLVPRACAGSCAGACLLQKPCCFLVSLVSYNKRRPLLYNLSHSHNRINTLYISTLPPISNSSTKTTDQSVNMPTYIVSLDHLVPYRTWPCLETASYIYLTSYRRLLARRMRPQSRSTRKINTATYSCISEPDSRSNKLYSAKKHAEDQGGKIGHSYNLIKGFSYVAPPD